MLAERQPSQDRRRVKSSHAQAHGFHLVVRFPATTRSMPCPAVALSGPTTAEASCPGRRIRDRPHLRAVTSVGHPQLAGRLRKAAEVRHASGNVNSGNKSKSQKKRTALILGKSLPARIRIGAASVAQSDFAKCPHHWPHANSTKTFISPSSAASCLRQLHKFLERRQEAACERVAVSASPLCVCISRTALDVMPSY